MTNPGRQLVRAFADELIDEFNLDQGREMGEIRAQVAARVEEFRKQALTNMVTMLLRSSEAVAEWQKLRESESSFALWREPLTADEEKYLLGIMQRVNEERNKFGLTPRELQIISGVVAGYSDREIAQYLKLMEDTITHHIKCSCDKLRVSTRSELAQFAVNHRLPLKAIL
jgi:DNA-binding CsgD family transcriptional regulator